MPSRKIQGLANNFFPEGVVATFYTKVVRLVPLEKQEEVIKVLKETKEMIFDDFVMCANRVDNDSIVKSCKDILN